MVIQVIDEISSYCDSIVESNRIRKQLINSNIDNIHIVDAIFVELHKCFIFNDLGRIRDIVSRNLFYEEVYGIDSGLQNSYNESCNKHEFIEDLKELYLTRGNKGIHYAWMPKILSFNVRNNQGTIFVG